METAQMRQKLHQYIDSSDEKLLKLMYAMAKEYNHDDDFEYTFTDQEIAEFEKRRQDRLEGKSKTYTWDESRKRITGK